MAKIIFSCEKCGTTDFIILKYGVNPTAELYKLAAVVCGFIETKTGYVCKTCPKKEAGKHKGDKWKDRIYLVVNTTTGRVEESWNSYWKNANEAESLFKALSRKARKKKTYESYVLAERIQSEGRIYAEVCSDGSYLVINFIDMTCLMRNNRFVMSAEDAKSIYGKLEAEYNAPTINAPYVLMRVVKTHNLELEGV